MKKFPAKAQVKSVCSLDDRTERVTIEFKFKITEEELELLKAGKVKLEFRSDDDIAMVE